MPNLMVQHCDCLSDWNLHWNVSADDLLLLILNEQNPDEPTNKWVQ